MGNELSIFAATRPGFKRCKKNRNPLLFLPDWLSTDNPPQKSNGNFRVNRRGGQGSSGCPDGLHGNSHLIFGRVIGAHRARPRTKSGRKFAIGQVFLAFIFAPTGNGLSFFRTATRSGFERCNKNPNPIINPIFYPIFYPIATRLPQIFICFQLKFHIPDPFQLILALDNTKRVFFCANPEVDFEYLEHLTFWYTFDGSAIFLSFKFH